mmetsp:Transcript_27427/g.55428  ORF Transcript_27427/g.55428 Transcript_27427/m.55428 type:complete len:151 (-) Transcript_27427:156-608(-)
MPLAQHLAATFDWHAVPGRIGRAGHRGHGEVVLDFQPPLRSSGAGARAAREFLSFVRADGADASAAAARTDEETVLAESDAMWVQEQTQKAALLAKRTSMISIAAVVCAVLTLCGEATAAFYSARDIRRKLNNVEEQVAQVAPEWREGAV